MDDKYRSISYRQLMHYTPHDNKFNLKEKGFDIEDFYGKIFVEISEFVDAKRQLEETLLNPDSDFFRPINIISGYSGNGKTTFIKWLEKAMSSNPDYYFEVTNLIQEAHRYLDKANLIIASSRGYLIERLKASQAVPFILANKEYFFRKFRKDENPRETYWDNLKALRYFSEVGNKEKVFEEADYLVENLNLKQIMLLYFLEKIFEIKGKGYKCCVFCFDNIDQINYEYLSRDLWDEFLDIYNILIDISQNDALALDFDVKGKFTFLMVIREANLAIINAHMGDRIQRLVRNRRFILTQSGVEILKARKRFADQYFAEGGNIHELLQALIEEPYTQNVFLPLFNYDYRRLFDCILFSMEPVFRDANKNYRHQISYAEYQSICQLSKQGGRGILFKIMIDYLMRNNFLRRFATNSNRPEGKGYCRASRLILTVLCSLCYPVFPEEQLGRLHGLKPRSVGLFELIQKMENIYPASEITKWLSEFFRVSESSWAHLVTIYNKQVSVDGIDFNPELLLIENILSGHQNPESAKEVLNDIKIQINASGYIYIRHLITHFEYFSSLISNENPHKNFKPLFQMMTHDGKRWAFEDVIESVLKSVKSYKKNTDGFFENEMILRGYSPDEYCKSHFAFRGLENKGRLYSTRVITTHIEYLDEFRWYLFHSRDFLEAAEGVSKAVKLPKEQYLAIINQYLADRIEEYIDIWERGNIVDNSVRNLMGALRKKVNIIKNNGGKSDLKHWVSIKGDEE